MAYRLSIYPTAPEQISQAKALAEQYQLDLATEPTNDLQLLVHPEHIELALAEIGNPITIDFTQGKAAHRRQFGGGRGQTLAKAIGLKKGLTPTVMDCTAGYGQDAFVLANLGCQITLIERNPALAVLLENAITKAQGNAEIKTAADRMKLIHNNAIDYLASLTPEQLPDVIYLDPMYPTRQKSALVKKEMQLLHQLVGPDKDSEQLLDIAQQTAKKRVVVKRPKSAGPIGNKQPHSTVESKNTRYDLYIK